jgi:DNA-binding MarR family transcriptional regulator
VPDPPDNPDVRPTYRTMRVLRAIGQRPGASNRQIAQDSGIVDQGQISKLLKRLAGLGLLNNDGAGQPQGAANAWTLTPSGERVARAVRPERAENTPPRPRSR